MSLNKTDRKRIFIIDGYAMLYRSHYALIRNPLITSYGLHTSALFGFSNQVLKLIRSQDPDYIVCAFDSKEKTFRHEMFKDYKANRPGMPQELQDQLPHLWQILDAMNLPVIKKAGVEADDIIGTLAVMAAKSDLDTFIVSGDKDFMQLMDEHTFLLAPGNRRSPEPIIYDMDGVEKKWGVPPKKIIDLLGLMGDSSDNVPGVSGVGEKTAVKLIKEFGSLEGALENVDKISNKRVYNGLKNDVENAKLSKQLVTILTDVELSCGIDELKKQRMDIPLCSEKFAELEFHALIKQLSNDSNSESKKENKKVKKNYKIIQNKKELDNFIKLLENETEFSFNLQTTSIIPMEAEIIGISFSIKENDSWYLPIKYLEKKENNYGEDDCSIVIAKLKGVLETESIKKIGQNIKYDMLILNRYGLNVRGVHFDTMVAAHILNPSLRSYQLDRLAMEYLNIEISSIEELIGRGRNKIIIEQVPLEKISDYAMSNADITLQLSKILEEKLIEQKLFEFYSKIEIPLISVLLKIEYNGTFVDAGILEDMSNNLGAKLKELVTDIYRLSGTEFNINSTQQLANILFDKLELPQIKKRSTAEDILKQLQIYHELPKHILEYRKYNKLKNTYVDALPELINKDTRRIHSTFNQTIAATGRLSSKNPNFQNIPIRSEEGKEIRKAFRSQKDGWKILSADYSQIELRIMAHISQDKTLINAFKNGDDVHSETACHVFNVSRELILPEMRRIAKVVNFGIMYGAGPFRISQELGISRKEAIKIIESYFNKYSGIQDYIQTTIEKARKDKFVETIMGRRRPIWDADSDNGLRRKASERIAINMPIQGSAAELIKLAMYSIHHELLERDMRAKMILQIHDELLFEFPKEEEQDLLELVIDKMENAMNLSIPIVVDYGVGQNWFEAH